MAEAKNQLTNNDLQKKYTEDKKMEQHKPHY
jgi:hypothetical protein